MKKSNQKQVAVEVVVDPQREQQRWYIALAAVVLGVVLIYLLRMDRVVGLYGDDAWYVLLAKALATGQGYTLTNSPSAQIMPLYPPGFPFLLSLLWRVSGAFPQNVWLLKSLSVVAMFAVGLVVYWHFHRDRELTRWQALALATVTASSPAFVFLATSTVMSECVFTLVQLLVIVVIERCVAFGKDEARQARAWQWALLGGALAAFAFLIRSAALGLVVAVVWYLFRQRLRKELLVYSLGVAVLAAPWMIYSRMHAPTAEQQAEQNSYIVQNYAQSFWQRKASYSTEGTITISELPGRVWDSTYHLLEYDFGALILYPMYRAIEPSEGRLRYPWHDWSSLLLSALIIIGFISVMRKRATLAEWAILFSLGIIVLWPFRPFRFVLPLLPWVIFYLLHGMQVVAGWAKRNAKQPTLGLTYATGILGFLMVVHCWSNGAYIANLRGWMGERPRWVQMFDDNERLVQWMGQNLSVDAVSASQNPALIHLYTGQKSVGSTEPARNWERWKQLQVRYYALTHYLPLGEPPVTEKRFKELYRTPNTNLRVLDLGEISSRPAWSE